MIKRELIGLMIKVPANIQYQLGDAVGVIADSDFWRRWDTLVDVSTIQFRGRTRIHIDTVAGYGITVDARQCSNEQRSSSGCPFHLQALETSLPV